MTDKSQRRAGLLLVAMVLAGCIGGRDAWVRVQSPHFDLIGTLGEGEAEDFVGTLETFRTALLAMVFDGRLKHPDRIVVVVADRLSQYSRTIHIAGGAMNTALPSLGLSEVLALDGEGGREQRELTAKHELTHAITLPYAPGMPHWYQEGLAGIFEVIDVDRERGVVNVGGWARDHQQYRYRPLAVDEVFGWQAPIWDKASHMQYATAIQLLQLLRLRYPRQLSAFEAAVRDGKDWTEAWSLAFKDRPIAQWNKELQAFTFSGQVIPGDRRLSMRIPRPTVQPARRASGAERHAARALLYGVAQGRRTEGRALALAREEIDASLVEDDPEATGLVAAGLLGAAFPDMHGPDVEVARLRRALARDPANWRAAILFHETQAPLQERVEALERAAVRHGGEPYLLAARARARLAQGDARAALDLARAAAGDKADAPYLLAVLLDALGANHVCDSDAVTRSRDSDDSTAGRKRVADYTTRCGQETHGETPPQPVR